MNNVSEIMAYFEQELNKILDQKEQVMAEMNTQHFALRQLCFQNPKQLELAKQWSQQPRVIQTGINLSIPTKEMADEVHKEIKELIIDKSIPIQEVEWFNFLGSTKWHFKFNY